MAVGTTTRIGLTTWSSGDDPMGRAQFQSDNTALENLAAVFRSGVTGSRPAADAASAARSFYYDTTLSLLYFTDGSTWKPLNSLGASGDAYTVVAGTVTTPQGTSTALARADHKHAISTASAATITNSNSEGTATSLARSDHNHALGTGVVTATQLAALSVGKAAIDPSNIVKATTGMLSFDTTNGLSLNISASFFEASSNALSLKAGSITTTQLAGNIGKALLSTDIVNAAGAITFSTANGLAVATSATVGISSNTLIVNTNSIDATHLKTTTLSAAGALSGGAGTALSVNTDASTIEISSNALRVKAGGIGSTHLAANSVTKAAIGTNSIVKASTGALAFDTTNGFAVNYDDTTIGTSSNALYVKNSSIGKTQVNAEVYVQGTMTGLTASAARIHISNGANPTGQAGDVLFKF